MKKVKENRKAVVEEPGNGECGCEGETRYYVTNGTWFVRPFHKGYFAYDRFDPEYEIKTREEAEDCLAGMAHHIDGLRIVESTTDEGRRLVGKAA